MIFLYLTNAAQKIPLRTNLLVDLYCPATKTYINLNFT